MSFTYDLSTSVGRVRMVIPDRNESEQIFSDEEIEAFLSIEGDLKLATALALETIASDQALVLKVITLLDLKTDGAKTSDALLARADRLRSQVDEEATIDWAEIVTTPQQWQEQRTRWAL
jgi:hypothetical protein